MQLDENGIYKWYGVNGLYKISVYVHIYMVILFPISQRSAIADI